MFNVLPKSSSRFILVCGVLLASSAFPFLAGAADVDKLAAGAAGFSTGTSTQPLRDLEALVARAASDVSARAEAEQALLRLLETATTAEARLFACQNLAIVGGEATAMTLGKLLHFPDTCDIACLALVNNPSPKSSETLRNAVSLTQGVTRIAIVKSLGAKRDAASVPLLAKVARSQDAGETQAAVAALGKVANTAAADELMVLRRAPQYPHKEDVLAASNEAAQRLAVSGKRSKAVAIYNDVLKQSQLEENRVGAFLGLCRLDKDRGEKRMLRTMHGDDNALRLWSIAGVQRLPSPDASARFAKEICQLYVPEQVYLLEALAARGDVAARSAVFHALESDSAEVRLAAIRLVGGLDDIRTVNALGELLSQPKSPAEQQQAELALATLKGGAAVDQALLSAMLKAQGSARAGFIAALGRRGNPIAIPALIRETASTDDVVAKAAFQAVARSASASDLEQLFANLFSVQKPEVREEAEAALAQGFTRIQDPKVRSDLLQKAWGDAKGTEARCSVLRLAPYAGGGAFGLIEKGMEDPVQMVRDTAFRSLAEWPDLTAWEPLLKVYQQAGGSPNRVVALRGLTRILGEENARPNPELAARYEELFAGAKVDQDRKLILGALSGFALPDALPLAYPHLESAGTKNEAGLAIKRIAEAIRAKYPDAAKEALQKLQ
jgi:HEAT repeat protein